MKKNIGILCVILILSLISTTCFAAQVKVGNTSKEGERIKIEFTLDEIPSDLEEISGITVRYTYDEDKMKYESTESQLFDDITATDVGFVWYDKTTDGSKKKTAQELAEADNVLFTAYYTQNENAYGETPITITAVKITNYNLDASQVVTAVSGVVDLGEAELPEEETHRLILGDVSHGEINAEKETAKAGEKIEIEAKADKGYEFDGWKTSDGGSFKDKNDATTTFTMPANDTTITAKFTRKNDNEGGGTFSPVTSYTITVTQTAGGVISPSTVSVVASASKTFIITPNAGYETEDVLINGESIGPVSSYTFGSVNKNSTITAKFKAISSNPKTDIPVISQGSFSDLSNDNWAYSHTLSLFNKGIISGDGANPPAIRPNDNITRAEAAKIALLAMGVEPEEGLPLNFDDAGDVASWAVPYVATAVKRSILNGSEGRVNANNLITREEMVTLLARAFGWETSDGELQFADKDNVSSWAKENVIYASEIGVLKGNDNMIRPKDTITRAEVFALVDRCMNIK